MKALMDDFQLFPVLDAATEAALRSSIERHGVIVPVVADQYERILDGYHRSRIADELDVGYETVYVDVVDDDHAREIARTLNVDRRHLDPEMRRQVVADLRSQGHSLRAIGGALGVDAKTVRNDLTGGDHSPPDRVVGRDGKTYRPARTVQPGELVADDSGEAHQIELIEAHDEHTLILHGGGVDALIVDPDQQLDVRPAITKPDLGGGISHPARYSNALLPVFADALPPDRYPLVLDPFAGTGRIHELPNLTVGVEIEPEWATLHPDTIVGSALHLPFGQGVFDAICTSPTYGNRLADSYDATDPHLRRSYRHDLGRPLHDDNSGAMQWGPAYQAFHYDAWIEAWRVLRRGGRLVLNIKDHIRHGQRKHVAGWHATTLISIGFDLRWCVDVETPNLRQGENSDARLPEQVWIFEVPAV